MQIPAEIVSGVSVGASRLSVETRPGVSARQRQVGVTVVAFTCGHCFQHDQFWSSVIPAFVKRVEGMRQSLQATLRLFLEEYRNHDK